MSNSKNKKAECVRRVGNWSKIEPSHRFDKKTFNKKTTSDDMVLASPKLQFLFDKIKELDDDDMKRDGQVYKHMIYSDVKTLGYGAKIIASAFIASGFSPSYGKSLQISETELTKTPYKNFAVLCSTPVYEKPISSKLRLAILKTYNNRPDNIHGKNIRFLILDQGYKEGIDVFDIKYIHLFEPTITDADERQAIGRGTRLCGQQGLKFHSEKGWPIHVFRYNSTLPRDTIFKNNPTTHDLFIELSGLNSKLITFGNELDKMCVIGAVDHDLTKNIHSFKISGKDNLYELPKDVEKDLIGSDDEKASKSSSEKAPPPIEKFMLYGREYYKGQPIKCKEGCKGTIPVPTSLLLIAWMVSSKDKNPFYTKRPRSFLCKAIMDDKQYCKAVNLIWHDPQYFIETYKTDITRRVSYLSKDNRVFPNHLKAIALYISEELERIKQKVESRVEIPKIPQHIPPSVPLSFGDMRKYINDQFGDYAWEKISIENKCKMDEDKKSIKQDEPTIIDFTPSQKFIKDYFQPSNPYKGMLIYHSVGTGKLCLGIATATNSFEKQGYTILWVTRHTLKSDVWKNMFHQVCSLVLQEQIKSGLKLPKDLSDRKRLLSSNWIEPISYKQFSNFLKGKNQKLKDQIVARNGEQDPLHKTLIIIDEAHKLYAPDMTGSEKPDVNVLRKLIHASYEKSGVDSARVLLMTGTPYTADPMDLIKLLNFLREDKKQLPETFEEFREKYLTDVGKFTKKGMIEFLQDINGYISYLNRENDIRQFAYPIISDIQVPISRTLDTTLYHDVQYLQRKVNKQNEVLKEEIPDIIQEIREKHVDDKEACEDIEDSKKRLQCKKDEMKDYKAAMANAKQYKQEEKDKYTALKSELRTMKNKIKEFEESDISQETILKIGCYGLDHQELHTIF